MEGLDRSVQAMSKSGKKRPGRRRQSSRARASSAVHEWVGGRIVTPFYVTADDPYRPEMILWMEFPEGFVVGSQLLDPAGPRVSFAESLQETMDAPLFGPPRRPGRVRVGDKRLAAEVRAVAPEIDVVVAPTPELHDLIEEMGTSMPGDGATGPSYFEDDRIPAALVAELFRAAESLYRIAPWRGADDSQLLRLDIPALGVEGACLSIIGTLGESLGFIIFPSLVAYDRFVGAMERMEEGHGPPDLGTSMLSLNFDRGADLPPTMRREAAGHGWPVASADAYPSVQHRDRDGVLRPLTEPDVRIVTACATSLGAFFVKHGTRFENDSIEPMCESYMDNDGFEVRFTVPYGAGPMFEVNNPATPQRAGHPAPKVGRNAPCPCGSGKKYKKCCMAGDESARRTAGAPAAAHRIDTRLIDEIVGFAVQRFGESWVQQMEDLGDPDESPQLVVPWAAYDLAVEGKTAAQWYREAQQTRLSESEQAWLAAQEDAWISIWEVVGVDPGNSLRLTDQLTGESREVVDVEGSRSVALRDVILARVVDYGEQSLLCGIHPQPLPPLAADDVLNRMRRWLRRKRQVPVERLRQPKFFGKLLQCWDDAVETLDRQSSMPPALHNTDGDPLLLTCDRFAFDPRKGQAIEKRLAALEGAQPPEADDKDRRYVLTRRSKSSGLGGDTVIGQVAVKKGALVVEANSVERADALRARVEAACGDLIRFRARDHSDPLAALEKGGARLDPAVALDDIPDADRIRIMREVKEAYYTDWLDQPVPALAGKTPRQAARTKSDRERLELLVKEHENGEARLPQDERFDFSHLRAELGLTT